MAYYSLYHNANFQSFVRQDFHPPIVKREYDDIKSKALLSCKELRRQDRSATIYAGEYTRKQLDETSQPKMRPCSPTRMNKPHPPEIFMVTTLHNLPGHYNCKRMLCSSAGKNCRASHSPNAKCLIEKKNKVEIFCTPSSNQAAEAWLKLASDKDRNGVEKMLNYIAENKIKNKETDNQQNDLYQIFIQTMKPEFVASAHQWLKTAEAQETTSVERLLRTVSTDPQIQAQKKKAGTSHGYRQDNPEYIIHPDWRSKH